MKKLHVIKNVFPTFLYEVGKITPNFTGLNKNVFTTQKTVRKYLISPVSSTLFFSKKVPTLKKTSILKSAHPIFFINGNEALAPLRRELKYSSELVLR
jgi:hypothetical protein